MTTFNNTIQIRGLRLNKVATITITPWNAWKSQVQNYKGLRIRLRYPVSGLNPPSRVRMTVSTCRGFVDDVSGNSSITTEASGGILNCIFDTTVSSPYVNLSPNVQHYINIKPIGGDNVNLDVEINSFDVASPGSPVCSDGPVTPGYIFEPVKQANKTSIISNLSVGQVASLKLPPKNSPDWGTSPPRYSVNFSHVSGQTAPARWELIISECTGSFQETLPTSVGRTVDYHLISSSSTGKIDIEYDTTVSPPPTYSLSVSSSGSGTVTSNPAGVTGIGGQASFSSGASVTLTATPASGSTFTGWTGDCSGTGTCQLTMNANKSVTATFGTATRTYAVLDNNRKSSSITISGGGLRAFNSTVGVLSGYALSTIGKSSGKWYFEVKNKGETLVVDKFLSLDRVALTTEGSHLFQNIVSTVTPVSSGIAGTWEYRYGVGKIHYFDGTTSGASGRIITEDSSLIVSNDLINPIGYALDMDNKSLTIYRVGGYQRVVATNLTGKIYVGLFSYAYDTTTNFRGEVGMEVNFGQSPFSLPVPSGFNAGLYE